MCDQRARQRLASTPVGHAIMREGGATIGRTHRGKRAARWRNFLRLLQHLSAPLARQARGQARVQCVQGVSEEYLAGTCAWLQPELQERRLFTVGGGRSVNQVHDRNRSPSNQPALEG
ncbi:lipase class 3 family protein [Dorcoceras hygrometricum]|uniref:Lipase class 3 family protein n=1 Tax=Dorcoceras hygrometricum TaxID=472368 RepID=A0A2Z7C8A8_9LAMI|nr:lipase class 3 family protein [Dorcoceras hygrometricum]